VSFILKYNVSEIGVCNRPQVEPPQVGQIERTSLSPNCRVLIKDKVIDNAKDCDSYINILSLETYREH
jgi:hypothetical protein